MTEIWAEIEFDGGGYEVSNLGNLRRNGKPLKQRPDRYGYLRVGLRRNGKQVLPTVHSLVAGAFIGPRPDGSEIAHLDGDQTNNRANNLAYVSPRENRAHSREHGTLARGETHGCVKLSASQVDEILSTYRKGDPKCGGTALAVRFEVDPATIRKIVTGRTWKHLRAARSALRAGEEGK